MSTDQATIDRLRAELAEARAIATKLKTRLALLRAYAVGQNARHEVTETSPTGDDWNKLYDRVLDLTS